MPWKKSGMSEFHEDCQVQGASSRECILRIFTSMLAAQVRNHDQRASKFVSILDRSIPASKHVAAIILHHIVLMRSILKIFKTDVPAEFVLNCVAAPNMTLTQSATVLRPSSACGHCNSVAQTHPQTSNYATAAAISERLCGHTAQRLTVLKLP